MCSTLSFGGGHQFGFFELSNKSVCTYKYFGDYIHTLFASGMCVCVCVCDAVLLKYNPFRIV